MGNGMEATRWLFGASFSMGVATAISTQRLNKLHLDPMTAGKQFLVDAFMLMMCPLTYHTRDYPRHSDYPAVRASSCRACMWSP